MSLTALKPDEIPLIDDNDNTVEADTRWMLARPELRAHIESKNSDGAYDCAADYEDPRIGSTLTATQVIDLLSIGKR